MYIYYYYYIILFIYFFIESFCQTVLELSVQIFDVFNE